MSLQAEIKKRDPFAVPEQEAFLNIMRTAGVLAGTFQDLLKRHEISPPQYNVLRILRGAGGAGLPSLEITDRMITRVPDITRLVDRLEAAGLATRKRTTADRRVVLVKITARGQKLLARLDGPIVERHQQLMAHLSRAELAEVNRLMVKIRSALPE